MGISLVDSDVKEKKYMKVSSASKFHTWIIEVCATILGHFEWHSYFTGAMIIDIKYEHDVLRQNGLKATKAEGIG